MEPEKPKKNREWAPRIWEGCNLPAWLRLLARNRFAVSPSHLYMVPIITAVSTLHTLLRFFEEALFRHAVARTQLAEPPLFILGHWRSGTTLLHELLILDERHSFPTTYQCLEPNHFILTEKILTKLLGFLLPSRRPMDNMSAGFDRPQEDEFAMCMLGEHSPYLSIAFPNRGPIDEQYLDLVGISYDERRRWKKSLLGFLKKLTFKNPKRLILKSPTHTARIPTLLDMFPDALFVYLTRNPYVVYPSTINLWKSFHRKHGLQNPTFAGLDEYVFRTFLRMDERYEAGKRLIPAGQLHELKYEDLVRDPLGELQTTYDRLGLSGFDAVKPRVQQYLDRTKGYETNKYELTPELKSRIGERWGDVIQRWGYAIE